MLCNSKWILLEILTVLLREYYLAHFIPDTIFSVIIERQKMWLRYVSSNPCMLEELVHLLGSHSSPRERQNIGTVYPGASNCREWERGENKPGSFSCVTDQFCRTLRKGNCIFYLILSSKNSHLVRIPSLQMVVWSCPVNEDGCSSFSHILQFCCLEPTTKWSVRTKWML